MNERAQDTNFIKGNKYAKDTFRGETNAKDRKEKTLRKGSYSRSWTFVLLRNGWGKLCPFFFLVYPFTKRTTQVDDVVRDGQSARRGADMTWLVLEEGYAGPIGRKENSDRLSLSLFLWVVVVRPSAWKRGRRGREKESSSKFGEEERKPQRATGVCQFLVDTQTTT